MTIKDERNKRAGLPSAPRVKESPGLTERPAPPRSVRIAVLLMYAGAAVTAIGLVLSVVAIATGDRVLRASHPNATVAQLHATKSALIILAVASAVIEIAAWLLLARANRLGLRWARIVATVLFGLNTVNLAAHLRGAATVGNTIYSAAIWLIGLAVIVFLWLRESGAYFASPTGSSSPR